MNKEIEELAKLIEQIQKDGFEKITKETAEFVKENHKYSSKDDYYKAHSKTIYEMTAEALYDAGYRKYESEFVKQEMNVADKKLIEFLMANKDSELPLKEFLQEYIKGDNEDERD